MKNLLLATITLAIAMSLVAGCKDEEKKDQGTCDLQNQNCEGELVCEEIQGGEPQCVIPVVITGKVLDITDDAPVEGALVQAMDANGAATGVSTATDADGEFSLQVPSARDAEGTPLESIYTLAVQAAGYYSFPTAIRPALPLDASSAVENENVLVVENPITTIKLIPLDDTSGLGSISGEILINKCAGIMVAAENSGNGYVGYSNLDCEYTVFNVPAGTYTVSGYAAGIQLEPVSVSLAASENATGVDLSESPASLSTVSGNIQIVNAPGGSATSVILALESTFDNSGILVNVPSGLRIGEVNGVFKFEDVPNGKYVVLAAYENDDLVQDPDQSIGGTSIVHIEVPDSVSGNDVVLPDSFKVTEALVIVYPGAGEPEQVDTLTPDLEWADDSSEKSYVIVVYDALGNEIWTKTIDGSSGSETVTSTYDGPALEAGMYYQFKVTSYSDQNGGGSRLSTTEDLKGVFYY